MRLSQCNNNDNEYNDKDDDNDNNNKVTTPIIQTNKVNKTK